MTKFDPKSYDLSQQLAALQSQAEVQLPGKLLQQSSRPIEQLIATGAVNKVLKEDERAPDFTLPDAFGHPVALAQLLKHGPVVIAFYLGVWCPYCNLQLHAYQQALPQLQALGASLVAISPQTPDHSLTLVEKQALTFSVLSDAGNQVARQFGLVFTLDEATRIAHKQLGTDLPEYNGDESWELPMPGTFLIDQTGVIRLAFVDPNFTRRLDPSIIIAQLNKLIDRAGSEA
ncbi:AhpC/TSA family protein [Ktedonosporobacter rubrisoli]|uniref:thioredoxin-dependent peroxiredoxin n=1 Tax=Ktedonosporobacter rubrisoli TaxID=2509675 RepID=A0A4P6JQC4_KTERU|nr:peroxiredoxin-like family protein [Ktedonosporobacter rubrisoli]QBD77525.1 AhpC/TSA family protein [Ktedonosporobacter rubrisoli]